MLVLHLTSLHDARENILAERQSSLNIDPFGNVAKSSDKFCFKEESLRTFFKVFYGLEILISGTVKDMGYQHPLFVLFTKSFLK